MNLRVKIREQAKTPKDIARYMSLCLGDAITIAENEKWVSVDVVSVLLDEAFRELDKRAFCYHNNTTRLVKFEDIRIVLSGKNE